MNAKTAPLGGVLSDPDRGLGKGGAVQRAVDWENRMREALYGPLGPNNAKRLSPLIDMRGMKASCGTWMGVLVGALACALCLAFYYRDTDAFLPLQALKAIAWVGLWAVSKDQEMPFDDDPVMYHTILIGGAALQWGFVGALIDVLRSQLKARQSPPHL